MMPVLLALFPLAGERRRGARAGLAAIDPAATAAPVPKRGRFLPHRSSRATSSPRRPNGEVLPLVVFTFAVRVGADPDRRRRGARRSSACSRASASAAGDDRLGAVARAARRVRAGLRGRRGRRRRRPSRRCSIISCWCRLVGVLRDARRPISSRGLAGRIGGWRDFARAMIAPQSGRRSRPSRASPRCRRCSPRPAIGIRERGGRRHLAAGGGVVPRDRAGDEHRGRDLRRALAGDRARPAADHRRRSRWPR